MSPRPQPLHSFHSNRLANDEQLQSRFDGKIQQHQSGENGENSLAWQKQNRESRDHDERSEAFNSGDASTFR